MPESTEQTSACPKCGAECLYPEHKYQQFTCGSTLSVDRSSEFAQSVTCAQSQLAQQAAAITRLEGEREALRELIVHCWVHSGYRDNGRANMTAEQQQLWDETIRRACDELDIQDPLSAAAQQEEEGK